MLVMDLLHKMWVLSAPSYIFTLNYEDTCLDLERVYSRGVKGGEKKRVGEMFKTVQT